MQVTVKRRTRLLVLMEILHICKSPLPKTRLMQKANLSYPTLKKCLLQLQDFGLIGMQPETREYQITPKGVAFLVQWGQLQQFLSPREKTSMLITKTSY